MHDEKYVYKIFLGMGINILGLCKLASYITFTLHVNVSIFLFAHFAKVHNGVWGMQLNY